MELERKLEILADAAKYDASCASSGAAAKDSASTGAKGGVGSTGGAGICHSFTPDGRCVSLLKILLTNVCLYDCHYCINRRSSNVRRAAFTAGEVVRLTLDFYKRNLIEGLFLSSGIIRSADYTMEQVVEVARKLREEHHFRGYIHLKTIPEAFPELIEQAGRYADRISINVELPTEEGLSALPSVAFAGIAENPAAGSAVARSHRCGIPAAWRQSENHAGPRSGGGSATGAAGDPDVSPVLSAAPAGRPGTAGAIHAVCAGFEIRRRRADTALRWLFRKGAKRLESGASDITVLPVKALTFKVTDDERRHIQHLAAMEKLRHLLTKCIFL